MENTLSPWGYGQAVSQNNLSRASGHIRNAMLRIAAVLVFLVIWELIPRTGLLDRAFLPPFSEVAATFVKLLLSGELVKHTTASLERAATGYGLAVLWAVPLGLMMGWFR